MILETQYLMPDSRPPLENIDPEANVKWYMLGKMKAEIARLLQVETVEPSIEPGKIHYHGKLFVLSMEQWEQIKTQLFPFVTR